MKNARRSASVDGALIEQLHRIASQRALSAIIAGKCWA